MAAAIDSHHTIFQKFWKVNGIVFLVIEEFTHEEWLSFQCVVYADKKQIDIIKPQKVSDSSVLSKSAYLGNYVLWINQSR